VAFGKPPIGPSGLGLDPFRSRQRGVTTFPCQGKEHKFPTSAIDPHRLKRCGYTVAAARQAWPLAKQVVFKGNKIGYVRIPANP